MVFILSLGVRFIETLTPRNALTDRFMILDFLYLPIRIIYSLLFMPSRQPSFLLLEPIGSHHHYDNHNHDLLPSFFP
ncbi:hypothetical protein HanRHA438_Chr03g0139151 [Helianthus annuus]|nr:hypothetical protein HanRHA438_Chr03g0139151 [Helianthus annuus]